MPVPSNPQDLINIIREKLFNNTSGLIEEPDLREVLENIVKVLDAKFSLLSPNLTPEQFKKWDLLLDYMVKETKGVLSPTSPAPTEKGKYILSSAGTYANLGGLVAAADKLNYAYFDGTTWSLIDTEVNTLINEVVKEEISFVLVQDNGDRDTLGFTNSIFSGFGCSFGILKNFNRLEIKYKDRADVQKATKMWVEIREDSYDGNLLFKGEKDLNFTLNEIGRVIFSFPKIENSTNKNIFIGYSTDGKCDMFVSLNQCPNPNSYRYTVYPRNENDTFADNSSGFSFEYLPTINVVLENRSIVLKEESLPTSVFNLLFSTPKILLPKKVWLYPNFQYNIFNDNCVIPEFGDNLNNYRLNYNGFTGKQLERCYRLDVIPENLNENITLDLMKGRNILETKTQQLLSSSLSSGNGVIRKVLIIGDSTVDYNFITTPLKEIFDNDVIDLQFVGTRGDTGKKHEGRSGWKYSDYAGNSRKLTKVLISGLTNVPSFGSTYSNNDSTWLCQEVNVNSGTGYLKFEKIDGVNEMLTSGTLLKVSGSGDSSVNYSGASIDDGNPFYNPTTLTFDIQHYLTQTSQTLGNGDWIFFQLGINDVFSVQTVSEAKNKVDSIMTDINSFISNIHAFNSNIRIGFSITIPPANQDGFGANYGLGQLSELYKKTGLLELQSRLIESFDNDTSRANNIFLIASHVNIDMVYNIPKEDVQVNSRNTNTISMSVNGVHPTTTGYAQIADMYAGIIKYFG